MEDLEKLSIEIDTCLPTREIAELSLHKVKLASDQTEAKPDDIISNKKLIRLIQKY